jgi:S1-C subfamily serine protease
MLRLPLLALLVAGSPQPAAAVVGGVEGGPLARAAVMVLTDRGGVCSAVAVSPDALLTAAHCVPAGQSLRVHWREGGQPVLVEPMSVARHPGFRANAVRERTRSIDLALVRLREPLPARFGVASLSGGGTPRAGAAVTVAGFGLSREGDASSTGIWRSAGLDVVEPYGPSTVLLWARGPNGAGGCQGDSGGPIVAPDGAVVAVTSWSTGRQGRQCGALTQGVLIAPHRDWIDRTLSGWGRSAGWTP